MGNIKNSPESEAFADAIMVAVTNKAAQIGTPNLGAVLGALVGVQAHFIAGVNDRNLRRSLERDLNNVLSDLISEQVKAGTAAKVQVTARRAN